MHFRPIPIGKFQSVKDDWFILYRPLSVGILDYPVNSITIPSTTRENKQNVDHVLLNP